MTEAEQIRNLELIVKEMITMLDGHKAALTELREECELHCQAVQERDLIIRDLRRDLEQIRTDRDTWKAVAQCG